MEMMTDPSHVGAERLAANMESYLASVEISHGRRGDQKEGCRKREVMWLLGNRGWSWDWKRRGEGFFSAEAKSVRHHVAD